MAFNINSSPYLGAQPAIGYGSPYQYGGGGVSSPFPTFQSPFGVQQMLAQLLQAISALSSQWGGLAGGAGNLGGQVGSAGSYGAPAPYGGNAGVAGAYG